MKSRLEKLEEFADWACKEHFKNMRLCMHAIRQTFDESVYVLGAQFDFEVAQHRRWSKWREHFQTLRKRQITWKQWKIQQKMLTTLAEEQMKKWRYQCFQCPYRNQSSLGSALGGIFPY